MARISGRVTQTYPGAPLQQFPHWVQEKHKPLEYQGLTAIPVSLTAFFRSTS